MLKAGIKHLIQCHCTLPQFRNREDVLFHKFVVFSVQGEDGSIEPKFSQCNNCGVIHKVTDICKSEIVPGFEDGLSLITIDDIKIQIPERLSSALEKNNCDLATWENVAFVIENKLWDSHIKISNNTAKGSTQVKILVISDKDSFKIETHLRQNDIVGGFTLR